ncbi:MAG: hypothetical protein MUE49_08960 [Rhodospirillales bacterium]|nr:hypothetical protein [Rhodospirillales bacterium]
MAAYRSAATSLATTLALLIVTALAAHGAAESTPEAAGGGASAVRDPAEATAALPIEIEADQGIEWFRDQQIVYARGNARAVRGDLTVTADVLGARYRDRPEGGQEVWQLDALGNVKIASRGQTAVGDSGVFDLDTGVLLLHGTPTRMVSNGEMISANREIEYATKAQVIIARGDAAARQGDRLIRADEITAHLERKADGGTRVHRIEASRDVSVVTAKEVIRGNRGDYDVTAGSAVVTGDVKITRGANQLSGCRGEIDFKAGVSRLLSCASEDRPVRGLIMPGASGEGRGTAPR